MTEKSESDPPIVREAMRLTYRMPTVQGERVVGTGHAGVQKRAPASMLDLTQRCRFCRYFRLEMGQNEVVRVAAGGATTPNEMAFGQLLRHDAGMLPAQPLVTTIDQYQTPDFIDLGDMGMCSERSGMLTHKDSGCDRFKPDNGALRFFTTLFGKR